MFGLFVDAADSSLSRMSDVRVRRGGPRRSRRVPPTPPCRPVEQYMLPSQYSVHMPLDIAVHWNWRNPLNILPLIVVVMVIVAVVAMLLT